MSKDLAPVILFTYNRPGHAKQVIDSLLTNPEVISTDLIVYLDGPKTPTDSANGKAIRALIGSLSGFRSVTLHESQSNLGLSRSLIRGITSELRVHESVIVLEDDILVAPTFLNYMNEGLSTYASSPEVASIHAHVYPLKAELPETFFIPGADCWGWATWRRAWNCFDPDGAKLLAELHRRNLIYEFDFAGCASFSEMLERQINGKNDSWAVRWHASAVLNEMITLYPSQTQALNIGQDGSGSHGGVANHDSRAFSDSPVSLVWQEPKASIEGFKAFADYFCSVKPSWRQNRIGAALYPLVRLVWTSLPTELRKALRRN